MISNQLDIRWEQRFSNYRKALVKLTGAVRLIEPIFNSIKSSGTLNEEQELQAEGLIQRFEYTHELAWKVMMDYASYQGFQDIRGSRDATCYALRNSLIESEIWMQMIESRNRTSHTYNDDTAQEILCYIVESYTPLFIAFESKMAQLVSKLALKKGSYPELPLLNRISTNHLLRHTRVVEMD